MNKKYPKYLRDCFICKKQIFAQNSGFDKPTRKFCSLSCLGKNNGRIRIWTEEAKNKLRLNKFTHGLSKNKLWKVWVEIQRRCYKEKSKSFCNYGARGIKVCEKWKIFEPFRLWSHNNGYLEGLTIDRINNDGNYEPKNCRWILLGENSKNRRPSNLWNFKSKKYLKNRNV